MVTSNGYLMIFALAMMGCVLATPLVTWIALWVGAIDRPDHFRRIHQGAIPRLGGLGLALGLATGMVLPHISSLSRFVSLVLPDPHHEWAILLAAVVILVVGFIDDTRSIGPRMKLVGQALAVLVLYLGGIQIQTIDVLGLNIELTHPSLRLDWTGVDLAIPSLLVTMFWFLGCMNIWNLIDGMDGLASGVGLLVSGTLTLVAIHNQNIEVAVLAVALAGGLAGFLLYNWHPACIFLGDSGALLIGLLIGVIGVEGSMKGPSAISILFPILAMGLPITDTAMAIFRRWVRNLPLSAADRRHVHHLLIGLGLNPRQAALMLYCFSGFLCGAVLLGVALRSEFLALVLGLFGCLAFLVVVTSRRDELANLRGDLQERIVRSRQERIAARLTWEAIQRIELCSSAPRSFEIIEQTAGLLGCQFIQITCSNPRSPLTSTVAQAVRSLPIPTNELSDSAALFRLFGGEGVWITIQLELCSDLTLPPDIVYRYVQRLGMALAERLKWLRSSEDTSPVPTIAEKALIFEPAHTAPTASGSGAAGVLRTFLQVLGAKRCMLRNHVQPDAERFPTLKSPAAQTGLARR